jgi:hypothetical protein
MEISALPSNNRLLDKKEPDRLFAGRGLRRTISKVCAILCSRSRSLRKVESLTISAT